MQAEEWGKSCREEAEEAQKVLTSLEQEEAPRDCVQPALVWEVAKQRSPRLRSAGSKVDRELVAWVATEQLS